MTFGSHIRMIVLCALGVSLCGCLFMASSKKVVHGDAERQAVEFEDETALMTFQKKVEKRYHRGGGRLGTGSVTIPFIMAVSETKVLSENAFYNTQIAKADVNADGTITRAEARAYAAN